MQWVILIIVLINLFLTLGLVGAYADKPKKTGHTFLDDEEPEFLETPVKETLAQRNARVEAEAIAEMKRLKRKKAVKQTTTLKKKASVAKSQKRAANGRFA